MKTYCLFFSLFLLSIMDVEGQSRPNIVLIYADDLGFGDPGCYGATKVATPEIDQLAGQGILFTNAHASSSTCTPSRYALLTGEYPWRKKGTGILPGDAALIIPTNRTSLASMLKKAGYHTGIVGKWHLGLGTQREKNWNEKIAPGPNETGFDYSFIFPATADRVPTVFMENGLVIGLDPEDPIEVNYDNKIGSDPTGKENPELLKMAAYPGTGHQETIVNGIARMGYMTGGKMARWNDEEVPLTFLAKAKQFIQENKRQPFFLFYSLTEPHAPRMPSTMFKGSGKTGLRGDAIAQLDWSIGQIRQQLEYLGMLKNTIIIVTSDNGPVVEDAYNDGSLKNLNGHNPNGPYRGGKYSILEAGNRVPFIVSWPGKIKPGVSDAMICQTDLLASLAALTKQKIPMGDAPDSENMWPVLSGKSSEGRTTLIEHGYALAIVHNNLKYIPPHKGPVRFKQVNIESGASMEPQLYDLISDPGESKNLAVEQPEKVKELAAMMAELVGEK